MIGSFFCPEKLKKVLLIFTLVLMSFFFLGIKNTFAATYFWNQTDWVNGADESVFAKHSENQSGWTKFFSKDVGINVGTGLINLVPNLESATYNPTENTTLTNLEIIDGKVQLKAGSGNKQVSTGNSHTCALKNNGTVWCWGTGSVMGINTAANSGTPVQVLGAGGIGILDNVTQISAGNGHTCAIKTDGTVWCWGYGSLLGAGDTAANSSTPVQVLGLNGSGVLNNVSQISSGTDHICTLKNDGTVWCWGMGNKGQLGINNTLNKKTPAQVLGVGGSGVLDNVVQISANRNHTCAIKTDSTVWCWGSNNDGELGIGSTSSFNLSPAQVLGVEKTGFLDNVKQIGAGGFHTCALKNDGTVWCWGSNNYYGQLGIGSTISISSTPVQVLGAGGTGFLDNVTQISSGYRHTCAIKTDGTAWCWGDGYSGQLGRYLSSSNVPIQILGMDGNGFLDNVVQINTGYQHNCVLKNDDTVWCWGYNYYGQLGINYNSTSSDSICNPVQVLDVRGDGIWKEIKQIDVGANYSCTVKTDNTAWCWGEGNLGQLGNGTISHKNTPTKILSVGGSGFLDNVVQISAGNNNGHTCAIKTDGTAWCWGYAYNGVLGNKTWSNSSTPVQVLGAGGTGILNNVTQISANYNNSCAVKTNGTAWCWGWNYYGQLGNKNTFDSDVPVQVLGLGGSGVLNDVTQISNGTGHTCALKNNGTVWCWGSGSSLGSGTTVNSSTPVQVLGAGGTGVLDGVPQISSGSGHTCALKNNGTVWCWGGNYYGQLGIGSSINNTSTPVQVLGAGGTGILNNVTQISAGESYNCVVKTDGTAWCWGYNYYGQLGNKSTTRTTVPVQVLGAGGTGILNNVTQISAGSAHTCAVKIDGSSWCWGYNQHGALGRFNSLSSSTTPLYTFDPDGGWELSLKAHYDQGNLLSSIFNLGKKVNLTKVSLTQTKPSNTAIKVQFKTADTEAGLTSADWSGSSGINSYYTDDSTEPQSVFLKQFVQYRAILETNSSAKTPKLSQIALNYQSFPTSGFLISSPFDSETDANLLSSISWIKSTPENTAVKFQIRTAANQNGLSSSDWKGPDGTSATFFTNNLGETTPASMIDATGDRWFQYKVLLESDGSITPLVYDTTMTYVVNAPPSFDSTYETNGFGITRSSTPGIFNFKYKVGDTDTETGSGGNKNTLWPTFQYTTDNGDNWTTISPNNLTGYTSENPIALINGSTYVEGATVWNSTADLSNSYNTVKVRMVIDDHEAANNTSAVTSDAFIIDNKKPTVGTLEGGGLGININKNIITSLAVDKTNNQNVTLYFNGSDDSDFKFRYSTDVNFAGVDYQNYVSSVGFTLSPGDGSKRVYVQLKDAYGNETAKYSDVIQLDTTAPSDSKLFVQDITNPSNNESRLFVNWPKNTDNDWLGYKVYRSVDNSDFSLIQTIDNININYLLDIGVTKGITYIYKITQLDDLSNESVGSTFSQTIGENPNDSIAPTVTNIQISNKTTSSVTVTWITDEVTTGSVLYSTDDKFESNKNDVGYSKNHSIVLSGLNSGTKYNFKVRSSDASGNASDSEADEFTTNTADTTGPVISNIVSNDITLSRATISFTTNELSSSFIEYSTNSNFTEGQIIGQNETVLTHSLTLKYLNPSTVYYYKIKTIDKSGNETISEEKTFTTLANTGDKNGPVIFNSSINGIKYNTAIINFTTDEISSTFVEFGKDIGYGRVYGRDDSVTNHSINFPYDLKPETVYYYRVRTKDISGNETIGIGATFITGDDPSDLVAPIISNVEIEEPQQNSVTINWTTNEVSTSIIGFSEDLTYSQEQGNSVMVKNHSVTLVGLKPKTVYYFRIKSADPSNNIAYDSNQSQGYQLATATGDVSPIISANQIKNVTLSSANIYWETDMESNSYVEYGLDGSYGYWSGFTSLAKNHTVSLTGLLSGVTYNFRVRSKSTTGSESVSQNYTLTTMGIAVTTTDTTSSSNPDEDFILSKIKNGTTAFLKRVLSVFPNTSISENDFIDALNSVTHKIVSSPSISSNKINVVPGVDRVTISWSTDKNSNSIVSYASEATYDNTKSKPYSTDVGNPSESVTGHSVDINSLDPNTTYHYQIGSKSEYGDWTRSSDSTFTTLSINSEIKDFKFNEIGEKSVDVGWQTNFESRAMINVVDVLSDKSVLKSEEQGFNKNHSFKTSDLSNSTNYQMKITHVAKDGTTSEASIYPFATSTSSEPPVVNNVRISNALISGTTEQVQTIISWKTDKPSTSRIIYGESSATELKSSTGLDKSLVTDHVVVTTALKPGKVYKFKSESTDAGANTTLSKDFIIMTPKTQQSVLDLIINNFTDSFSFLNKGKN